MTSARGSGKDWGVVGVETEVKCWRAGIDSKAGTAVEKWDGCRGGVASVGEAMLHWILDNTGFFA